VERQAYDVVLMDVQMPEMDGLEATRTICARLATGDRPRIVAMTANAMQGDRERCLAAGMNDHVAKPIEPEDLWKALLKWIRPEGVGTVTPAGLASVAPDPVLPAGIEGLDMVNGLRRVLGKKPLYLSMLRKFLAGQKSAGEAIGKSLDAGDWGLAERLAHTLKSVSGNIGATSLQQAAADLEAAIVKRASRDLLDAALEEVKGPLAHMVQQLDEKLPREPEAAPVVVDRKALGIVCGQLEALLADDDAQAGEVLDANAGMLRSAFPAHYREIEAGIRAYDFEKALAVLRIAARGSAGKST
jgi:CheY-like chemotaxis protein